MTNPLFPKKLFKGVVLELGAVVASYGHDQGSTLTLDLIGELDDDILGLTLLLEKEYPSVS